MHYLVWVGGSWVVSRVFVNASEGVENVADAGIKTAGAALLGLAAFLLYKKVAK